MDKHEIAEILYKLTVDMDFMDYADTMTEEINAIAEQLKHIDLCTPLGYTLYRIAEDNENLLQGGM